jgi:hypothetical protein
MFVRSIFGAVVFSLTVPVMAMAQQAASTPTPEPAAPVQEPVVKEDMKLSTEKDVGYGAETSFLTWHGYLDLEFLNQEGAVATFDLHEFYLSAKAQVSQKVSVTAEFEYEHAPEKLILPIQAYADYKFSDALVVRGGIFFVPIGLPRTYTLRGNKNRMIRQNALTHDLMFENWAEHGINVFGQFKSGFFYDLALTNGMPNTMATGDSWFDGFNTLQDHTEDNNSNKASFARVGFQKKNGTGDFNVGVSYATQKYDPAGEKEMTHSGFDVRYLHKSGLRFQGEYMRREGDDNAVDLTKGIAADANGWVAQVSRRFPFNSRKSYIEPVFQVDAIDLNEHTQTNGDKMYSAVGLVLSPVQNYSVKFEYDWVKEVHGANIKNNKLWLALVAEF